MDHSFLEPNVIASVGFPIVVASYLLVRQEKVIRELTKAVIELQGILLNVRGLKK